MFCIDTAASEPVVADLQTRCRGAAKPLSRDGFPEVGESEAGQLDMGAVTSAGIAGVGASSPVDDADFPSPLTAGCDPEDEATRSDPGVATRPMIRELPWPAYLNELGGEGTDNDIFLVCYREIWAVLPDANLIRAYIDTSPDPAFVNRRQRHIIMDCLIERVLRIDECRRSKCRFAMEVDNLFAAYPEWDVDLNRCRIYQSAFKVNKQMGYIDMFKSSADRRPKHKKGKRAVVTGGPVRVDNIRP